MADKKDDPVDDLVWLMEQIANADTKGPPRDCGGQYKIYHKMWTEDRPKFYKAYTDAKFKALNVPQQAADIGEEKALALLDDLFKRFEDSEASRK